VNRCCRTLAALRPSDRILRSGRPCGPGPIACARTAAAAGSLRDNNLQPLAPDKCTDGARTHIRGAERAARGLKRHRRARTRQETRSTIRTAARTTRAYPSCRESPTRTRLASQPWRADSCRCRAVARASGRHAARARPFSADSHVLLSTCRPATAQGTVHELSRRDRMHSGQRRGTRFNLLQVCGAPRSTLLLMFTHTISRENY